MNIKLIYTHPTLGATTDTLSAMAIRGVSAPDEVEFVPPVQYRAMGGTLSDQFAGFRRVITLDLGVMTGTGADSVLYFLQDEDRALQTALAAPGNLAATLPGIDVGLPADTYYYVVTAVDESGESASSVEDSQTTVNLASTIDLAWDAVVGAKYYNVYRSLTSGDYDTPCLLTRTTALTYRDQGLGTSADFLPGEPSGGSAFYVALIDAEKFANEWIDGIQYSARYILKLRDRTLKTLFPA